MRRVELEVEHSYKNKFVGKHRFRPSSEVTILGSSRNAHIRLLGESVEGIHASLEYTDQAGWILSDLGSEKGTWVKKRPIVEQSIRGTVIFHIGGHVIKMTPHEINSDIFKADDSTRKSNGDHLFHQVIVRKRGVVVDSFLLQPNEEYRYAHGGSFTVFAPPQQKDVWGQKNIGDVTVQHRLTSTDQMQFSNKQKMQQMMDPSLRAPMGGAVVFMLLVLALIFLAPQKPDDELVELKPDQNQYTRMIFDAKKIKKNKKKAIKMTKNIKGHTQKQPQTAAKVAASSKAAPSKQAAKVVSKIKAAGLGQLIGKISKRAAKSATFVAATGRSPDSAASGHALGVAGSATLGKTGKIGGSAGARIGGVATEGKGGGSTAYKGIGGLSAGNIGNAEVGVLEEETEVQGGLEREVIARYIKSQLGQIRYCYERQLSASPDLYGKVKVKFTIGAAGAVVAQGINTTSLKNAMVEGCILRRIAGWQFPKPEGGTQVNVSYPFLFKSTK